MSLESIFFDEENNLTVLKNTPESTQFFLWVEVTTEGGLRASKGLEVTFDILVNTPPYFVKSLPDLHVVVDEAAMEDGSASTKFEYSSPIVKDEQGDKVKMSFFLPLMPCDCLEAVQDGNFFNLKLDKSRVTQADVGRKEVRIMITDESLDPKLTSEIIGIQIDFIPKPTPVEEETPTETENEDGGDEPSEDE